MLQFASVSIQGVIPLSRGVFSLLSQDSGSSLCPGKGESPARVSCSR